MDDALKPGTQIGPVVDQKQLDQDLRYIGIGRDEGAKLAWGGERLNRETPGFYLQPALFTETSNDMRINREEIFGPVATRDPGRRTTTRRWRSPTTRRSGCRRASAPARSSTPSISSSNSEAGMVMVNLPTAGVDYHVPFGGRKGSSLRAARAGPLRRRVLHHRQDQLHDGGMKPWMSCGAV